MSKDNLPQVTQSLLREYFTYDGKDLRWRTCRKLAQVGEIAGGIARVGYRRITLFNKQYYAHRLIWLYSYGVWPKGMLDHKNRDKTDNRLSNLREADMSLNVRNRGGYPSKTGVKGVYPHKDRYRASIQVADKQTHLGVFDTIAEARAARKQAEAEQWC